MQIYFETLVSYLTMINYSLLQQLTTIINYSSSKRQFTTVNHNQLYPTSTPHPQNVHRTSGHPNQVRLFSVSCGHPIDGQQGSFLFQSKRVYPMDVFTWTYFFWQKLDILRIYSPYQNMDIHGISMGCKLWYVVYPICTYNGCTGNFLVTFPWTYSGVYPRNVRICI